MDTYVPILFLKLSRIETVKDMKVSFFGVRVYFQGHFLTWTRIDHLHFFDWQCAVLNAVSLEDVPTKIVKRKFWVFFLRSLRV